MSSKRVFTVFYAFFILWAYFAYAEWELRFYGAVGGEVAGSCYILTDGIEAILIDCGSHMSEEIEVEGERIRIHDYYPFDFAGEKIKAIVITHAHLDHIGRLHYFFLHYPDYAGPVYMTYATKEIYFSNLSDTVKYMKDKTGADLDPKTKGIIEERLRKQTKVVDYLTTFSLTSNVSAYFVNTGHIPGAAAVVVNIREGESVTTITFSGDIGPGDHPFLPPLSLEDFSRTNTDILVIESTYGNVIRDPSVKERELQDFYYVIKSSYENNRLVIIPTFALDRTQRVLATILEGIKLGILPESLKIAIGGDSSRDYTKAYMDLMAGDRCHVYFSSTACTSKPLNRGGFEFQRFSWNPDLAKNYNVVITPSGTGDSSDAKILLQKYLSDPSVVVLKVGWAPTDSPMGQLAAGKQTVTVSGQNIPVHASFRNYHSLFSGHADQRVLLEFVQAFPNLKCVVIAHGSENARNALETCIISTNPALKVIKPSYRQALNLRTLKLSYSCLTFEPSFCIRATEAREHVGERAWVCGVVKSVRRLDYGRVFLNLGRAYPNQVFTVMVEENHIHLFDSMLGKGWERGLLEKTVCVEGVILLYNNIPEIIATDPKQLKVISEAELEMCPCY